MAASSPPLTIATIAQWASIIARAAPALRYAKSTMISCLAVNGTECYLPAGVAVIDGKNLDSAMVFALTPGEDGFIGLPPAELARLVQETMADASTLSADVTDLNACLKTKTCQGSKALAVVLVHLSALDSDFDAWTPYI